MRKSPSRKILRNQLGMLLISGKSPRLRRTGIVIGKFSKIDFPND